MSDLIERNFDTQQGYNTNERTQESTKVRPLTYRKIYISL